MTLENKYNRGTHGDSSHMLSTVVLSNENQTCRGWEATTSTGEDVTTEFRSRRKIRNWVILHKTSGNLL